MDRVYEELDEAKAEIEKLREDYRTKVQLSENLKRAHSEQLSKFQEASLKMEKLSEELNDKAEEISVAKQMCEELKSNLKEKEAAIKHLISANDKHRADSKEKLQRYEEESRGLALALDEANAKNLDQKQQIRSLKEEVEGLREIVSASQIKHSEGDKRAKAAKEVKQREDVLLQLEEDKCKYENQLKWKKEQFAHLEEAHQKLRHQFQVSEKEWEKEKASLFDEISRLQISLDSQTRISESLQNRLQMCNQALAQEESKRKYLEVQLSESKRHFDNVFSEYEEAKFTIEGLTGQRDKEIASLRNSLGTKESIYKEMEYQVRMLKQENKELMASLKELQEAQIQEGGGSYSSLPKLRNKLKSLEQVHRDCSARLKSKEAKWDTELGILREKLNCCSSELHSRNILIDHLKMEAEAHDSLIVQQALHNEEAALMILVLKSGFLEAKMKLADAYADLDRKSKEYEERLSQFRDLQKVHKDCSARLNSKEAEWNYQHEVLMEQLESCRSELESKKSIIDRHKKEAEAHDSMVEKLALHDEEAVVMVLMLKAALKEAQLKLADVYTELDDKNQVIEESLSLYRGLEQVHKDCYARLKSKEAEWNSQLEILMEKLKCCSSELEVKNIMIDQLKMEAEAHDSMIEQLAVRDEEASLMILVLKSQFMEAHTKLADAYADLDKQNKEANGSISQLLMQLEMKNSALTKAHWDSEEERKKVSHLLLKVESVSFIEEQQLLQNKEFERLEKILSESHTCQSELKKQLMRMKVELKEVRNALKVANQELDEQICRRIESEFGVQLWRSFTERLKTNLEENHEIHRHAEACLHAELRSLKGDLKKVRRTLDRANEGLDDRFCEVNKADFELQLWKSIAEHLKATLEENHQMRKEVEVSLLAEVALEVNLKQEKEGLLNQLEEKDEKINDLNERITQLNQELETRGRWNFNSASTKSAKSQGSEQRSPFQSVNSEEEWVKKELEGAILAQVDAEENYEHEKESLHQLVEERDQRIEHLQQLVKSLEQEFESSTSSFSSRLYGMQSEMYLFREAWHKITTSIFLKEIEIEEKNLIILELENDVVDLEACLKENKSEVQRLTGKLEEELSLSDVMKLSSERENLLVTLGGLSDRMNKLSMEDMQLMESLRSIMHSLDSNELGTMDLRREDYEQLDSEKENSNHYSSPRTKKAVAIIDERLPFKALNS